MLNKFGDDRRNLVLVALFNHVPQLSSQPWLIPQGPSMFCDVSTYFLPFYFALYFPASKRQQNS